MKGVEEEEEGDSPSYPRPPPVELSLRGMAFSSVLQHNHSPTSVMMTTLIVMVIHQAQDRGNPP